MDCEGYESKAFVGVSFTQRQRHGSTFSDVTILFHCRAFDLRHRVATDKRFAEDRGFELARKIMEERANDWRLVEPIGFQITFEMYHYEGSRGYRSYGEPRWNAGRAITRGEVATVHEFLTKAAKVDGWDSSPAEFFAALQKTHKAKLLQPWEPFGQHTHTYYGFYALMPELPEHHEEEPEELVTQEVSEVG